MPLLRQARPSRRTHAHGRRAWACLAGILLLLPNLLLVIETTTGATFTATPGRGQCIGGTGHEGACAIGACLCPMLKLCMTCMRTHHALLMRDPLKPAPMCICMCTRTHAVPTCDPYSHIVPDHMPWLLALQPDPLMDDQTEREECRLHRALDGI